MRRRNLLDSSLCGLGGTIRPETTKDGRPIRARMLLRVSAVAVGLSVSGGVGAASAQDGDRLPVAQRCADGVIRSIELDRRTVFDPESTNVGILSWTYRLMNVLHVNTSPSFIRRELLFEEGDCYDQFLIDESERLLYFYPFLGDAQITSEDDGRGGRNLLVSTYDEWSTQVDVGVTYDAGLNLEVLEVTEENFLGQGIFAEFEHRERREVRAQSFSIFTPRFFGRADASIKAGRDRPGNFFEQFVRYPFIGETGRYSLREGYSRGTNFFSFSTDGAEAYSQVLVPSFREIAEVSAATRFGDPFRAFILGLSVTRDVVRFPRTPEVILQDQFDEPQPFPGTLPTVVSDQLRESASTRVALHIGTKRFQYEEYFGIDALRDRILVPLGFYSGMSLGKGFALLEPSGVRGVSDLFGRAHSSFGAPVGSSLLHGGFTVEARREGGDWRDLLADIDVVGYLRNDALPGHTLFVRAGLGGGWRTDLPYQLTLGGREGLRALSEDRFPGGRMARFSIEDRVVLPWPSSTIDLGLTAFADIGRVWAGDVPYATDSGWQTGLGFGLRLGLPRGTRNALRLDLAFPVGASSGSPIFRTTYELQLFRLGFFTPEVFRSRRFNFGAEQF